MQLSEDVERKIKAMREMYIESLEDRGIIIGLYWEKLGSYDTAVKEMRKLMEET